MSGWPSRILKSMLGATLRDARPVEKPELEWAARYIELTKHAAVGAALVIPRATLCAEWNTTTSSFTVHHQAEAWNVNNVIAHPTLTRYDAGSYGYVFASTYDDMDGNAVPFDPRGFRVCECVTQGILMGTIRARCRRALTEGTPTILITLKEEGSGISVDVPFWLEVL
jgi:hypothetical protein